MDEPTRGRAAGVGKVIEQEKFGETVQDGTTSSAGV